MNSLVAYSLSSESEDEDSKNAGFMKAGDKNEPQQARLPLPAEIKNMKIKSIHDVPEDDPSKHEGRIRSFQHERGNWATFVYIPVNISIMDDLQNSLIDCVKSTVDLKPSSDIHISLTKTVVLPHHWIDSFVSSVRNDLACINKFSVPIQHLKIYCNEERTRTFIGLQTNSSLSQHLEKMSNRLDLILREYRLPEFYPIPSFHSSILWCVGDHEAVLNGCLITFELILESYMNKHSEDFQINVDTVYCKTGNKLFRVELL